MEKGKTKDILLLIDANSLIHRAFHALPPFKTPSGEPSGALYGLASMLIKIIRERSPRYIVAAFDRPEPTLRKKEYKEYKATRKPTAGELIDQLIEAHNLLKAFGIKSIDASGWEADDIIATLASRFGENLAIETTILSGDLDILQVVNNRGVVAELPKKGISQTTIYNANSVVDRFGVKPSQLADYKGLVGDTSDNIPGVPGIGPKTAEKLINEYTTLENMYTEIEGIGMNDEKLRKKLSEYKEQALLSKKLAILETNVPINITLEEIDTHKAFNKKSAIEYARKLGSDTLVERIENDLAS